MFHILASAALMLAGIVQSVSPNQPLTPADIFAKHAANLIGYGRPFDVTWSIIDSEAFDATIDSTIRSTTDADYVVRISPSSGVRADISFNKTTFLIDSVVVDPGRDNVEESYADYKRFGPTLIATTRKNEDATTTVTDFKWDAQLYTTDFDRPTQQTYVTF